MTILKLAEIGCLVGVAIAAYGRGLEVQRNFKPSDAETKRREKSKTDPSIEWSRFDELAYATKILLVEIQFLLARIVIVLIFILICLSVTFFR